MAHHVIQPLAKYQDFIIDSIKRDVQSRYQNSVLGALWLILQPLTMIAVYTVVFSNLMHARMPEINNPFAYSIYLCAGILTWSLFTQMLTGMVTIFLNYAHVLKKINVPKLCLPIIVASSSLFNFIIIFILFIIFLICSNNFPGIVLIMIIPVLFLQIIFTVALGLILGIMNVFVRDIGHFVTILLQLWFWFTPIVYITTTLPSWAQQALKYNPLAAIIQAYQTILLHQQPPVWNSLINSTLLSVILFFLACTMYKKYSADLVDEL